MLEKLNLGYLTLIGMLFISTANSFGSTDNRESTGTVKPLSKADSIIESGIAEKHFPGAVLVIGRKDKVLYEKAYGHYTYETSSSKMTMDTLFDMASVSKVVGTATTAMALVEAGELDIDKPVSTYIEGFEANGKEGVRPRDLMTHTSGLKSYDSVDEARKYEIDGKNSADALIARISSLKLSNPTGTTTTYSCLNMLTQARVNENILGSRQDDFLTTRVYKPIGMVDTTYRPTEEQLRRTAPTVAKPDGTDLVGKVHDPLASYYSPEVHCPGNAGVFSSGPDMAKFCEMTAGMGNYRGKQIFRPDTILKMTSIQTPKELSNVRGLGWDIYPAEPYATPANNQDGKRAIAHTGYTGTMVWIDMNTGAYMVLLTNRTYPDDNKRSSQGVSKARREIIDLILRAQPEYAEHFAALPPAAD